MNLLSIPTMVESPFVIVKIGEYTFGNYTKISSQDKYGSTLNVTYPNYMKSIEAVKVNGQVNTYTITMEYRIKAGDDPNMLDKVFSSIADIGSDSRKITLSYGDWMSPSFIYKEETALITSVTSSVDYSGSCITYTIKCISDAMPITSVIYDFPKRKAKPSDIIKEILYNKEYKLTDVFYGMVKQSDVMIKNLIASDDKVVEIPSRRDTNILSYLNFLINNMVSIDDDINANIRNYKYSLVIVDDVKGEMNGPYFKVVKVGIKTKVVNSLDTYEIDIGYPGDNFVTQFSLKNDQSWAMLYQYSQEAEKENYIYRVGDDGKLYTESSPSIMRQLNFGRTTNVDKTWWTNMTQFPVSATMIIKGLVRPSILMSKVKVNVYFYGRKHVSSGTYVINKQVDRIDANGYKTTLNLLRLGEDY